MRQTRARRQKAVQQEVLSRLPQGDGPIDSWPKNFAELGANLARIAARGDILDDNVCPACLKSFGTVKGCNRHMSTAKGCSWYRKGKYKAVDSSVMEAPKPPKLPAASSILPTLNLRRARDSYPSITTAEDSLPFEESTEESTSNEQADEVVVELKPLEPLVQFTRRQLRLQKAVYEREH